MGWITDVAQLPDPARLPRIVALDTETYDPMLKSHGPGWAFVPTLGDEAGWVFMVSLAWRDPDAPGGLALPVLVWRDPDGDHTPTSSATRKWLRDVLTRPDGVIAGYNVPYDLGWLCAEGLPWPARHADAHVYAALLDEHRRSYALDAVAPAWLGEAVRKDETGITAYAKAHKLHPKSDLWRMPTEVVLPYAQQDARITWQLATHLSPFVRAACDPTMLTVEHETQRVLWRTRQRGIRVDLDRAATAAAEMTRERDALVATHFPTVQKLGSAAELAPLLIADGHTPGRTAKSQQWSITKSWLKQIAPSSPTAAALLRVRWYNKQLSTYLLPMERLAVNGRLHGQLHGLRSDDGGTVSGRLSSSTPNLQNVSAKADPDGIVRGCYLPEPGQLWAGLDYGGQEARLAVHDAYVRRARGADQLVRLYRDDARLDIYVTLQMDVHRMLDDADYAHVRITRDQCKVLFLAAMYGMGDAKCAEMLGVPRDVADMILHAFRSGATWLSQLKSAVEREAKTHGLIRTPLLNRVSRFYPVLTTPDRTMARAWADGAWRDEHGRRLSTHTALNRAIQGGAADQIKAALVALDRANATILCTVHDEIDTSVTTLDEAKRQAQIMADVIPLSVPVVVDVEVGPTWGSIVKDPDLIRSTRYWKPTRTAV